MKSINSSKYAEMAKAMKQGASSASAPISSQASVISNDVFRSQYENTNAVTLIPVSQIAANPANRLSMNEQELETLEKTIHMTGLEPLEVRKGDPDRGELPFVLLSGHRRLICVKRLIEKGLWSGDKVECKIINLNSLPVDLPASLKEKYVLRTRNKHRLETDYDKLVVCEDYYEIVEAMRKADMEVFSPSSEDDPSVDPILIKGVRTRSVVAQLMSIGETTVSALKNISDHASIFTREALREGTIDIWKADKISKYDVSEQQNLLKQLSDNNIEASHSNTNSENQSPSSIRFTDDDLSHLHSINEKYSHFVSGLADIPGELSDKDAADLKKISKLMEKILKRNQLL